MGFYYQMLYRLWGGAPFAYYFKASSVFSFRVHSEKV